MAVHQIASSKVVILSGHISQPGASRLISGYNFNIDRVDKRLLPIMEGRSMQWVLLAKKNCEMDLYLMMSAKTAQT